MTDSHEVERLSPVAWRWRWGKLGSNTGWHFSPVKPGPFPEEGYEVQPLYAHPPSPNDINRKPTPEGK